MSQRVFGYSVLALALTAVLCRPVQAAENTPGIAPQWVQAPKMPADAPNIVVILLDDVGFAAASTFGGPADTPVLERLAQTGLKYTRFHTTALCSPTRAALLSGRNHHEVGFGTVTEVNNSYPGYNAFWPKSVTSLPEFLRRNGYSTGAWGKWHNTPIWEINPIGPFDRWPTGLGFEYFYGFMMGEASQWEPPLYRNTTPVEPGKTPKDGYYLTTDLVSDAVSWVQNHDALAPEKPYFLYFATGATHAPHHVPAEWIAKYKGKFDQGWDKLSAESFEREKKLGVIPANADKTPRSSLLPAWDSLSSDQKRLYARQMEVYSAYLAVTDHEIGRLIDTIRKGPKGDNTLIFYIVGDNGQSVEGGADGSDENTAMYAGIPNDIPRQLAHMDGLGSDAFDNIIDRGWAFALGTPFQGAKSDGGHFGGTRNPLVVSWPARIKDVGKIRTPFTHVNDIAPTLYDLLGLKFPSEIDGVQQKPIEGVSFARSFFDANVPSDHHQQYFEIMGNRAIYKDGWIAAATHVASFVNGVAPRSTNFDDDRWELYNIDQDFSEAHDLAGENPQKLKEMRALFESEGRRNNVFPLANPDIAGLFPGTARPTLLARRKEFTFPGTLPRLPTASTPILMGSHRITAEIEVPSDGGSGAIFADGGRYGGYALYVKDARLTYECNFFGDSRSIITATVPLTPGHHEVAYEFQHTDIEKWGGGTGRLFVDGKLVGEGPIARMGFAAGIDTMDIGADRGSPVSESYDAPAIFTGKVDEVRLKIE